MAIHQFCDSKSKVKIRLQPGDLLLFHSTLLHRGIFFTSSSSGRLAGRRRRRLIQVFEVFHRRETQRDFLSHRRLIHIPADPQDAWKGKWMQSGSKMPLVSGMMNWIGYLNAATGYNLPKNDSLIYSSEAARPRTKSHIRNAAQNTYVFNPNVPVHDIDPAKRSAFIWRMYTLPYLFYISATILVIILMAVLVVVMGKKMMMSITTYGSV